MRLMVLGIVLFFVGCGSSSSAIIPSAGLTDEQKAALKQEDLKVDDEEGTQQKRKK